MRSTAAARVMVRAVVWVMVRVMVRMVWGVVSATAFASGCASGRAVDRIADCIADRTDATAARAVSRALLAAVGEDVVSSVEDAAAVGEGVVSSVEDAAVADVADESGVPVDKDVIAAVSFAESGVAVDASAGSGVPADVAPVVPCAPEASCMLGVSCMSEIFGLCCGSSIPCDALTVYTCSCSGDIPRYCKRRFRTYLPTVHHMCAGTGASRAAPCRNSRGCPSPPRPSSSGAWWSGGCWRGRPRPSTRFRLPSAGA